MAITRSFITRALSHPEETSNTNTVTKKHNLLTESDQIRQRWKEYIEDLYNKKGKPKKAEVSLESDVSENCRGPELLYSLVSSKKHCQS